MKTFVLPKEQDGFRQQSENSRSCGLPKWQNLPLIRLVLTNKMKKLMMMLNRHVQITIHEVNRKA